MENNPAKALDYASRNYTAQKEPRDAEVLLRTALAANKPAAAQPVIDWLKVNGYEDPLITSLAAQLAGVKR